MDPSAQNTNNIQATQGVQNATPQVRDENKTVAAILLAENLITEEQYNQIKTTAVNQGQAIDKVLLDSKLVSEEIYYEARAKLIGLPFVSVATLPFSPEALSFVPRSVAERFNAIPFAFDKESNTLSVAMSDPLDLEEFYVRQFSYQIESLFLK